MTTLEETAPLDRAAVPLRRNRDFMLLWTGAGISILGSRISAIAYSLLVLWATGSPGLTSLVTFAALLPFLVTQLPAGALVDRLDRRRVMIGCDVGRIVTIGVVAVTVILGHVWVPLLMVVAFVEASLTVMYVIAERAAVYTVVHDEQIGAAIGANEARGQAAGLIGQPIGTFLFAVTRWMPFGATAVAHLISLTTLLFIKKDLQGARDNESRSSLAADVAEGFRFVWGQKYLRRALGLVAANNILFQIIGIGLLVMVQRNDGSPTTIGFILAASGIGGMLGALTSNFYMRRIGIRRIFMFVNAAWAALMTAIAFTENPVALGAIFCALLYGAGVGNVAGIVYTMKVAPEDMQGRVGSIATLLASGANALGALAAGAILEALSIKTTMLMVGGVMLVIAVLTVLAFGGREAAAAERAAGIFDG
jgi:predicted MFS family arabinose efflux permease